MAKVETFIPHGDIATASALRREAFLLLEKVRQEIFTNKIPSLKRTYAVAPCALAPLGASIQVSCNYGIDTINVHVNQPSGTTPFEEREYYGEDSYLLIYQSCWYHYEYIYTPKSNNLRLLNFRSRVDYWDVSSGDAEVYKDPGFQSPTFQHFIHDSKSPFNALRNPDYYYVAANMYLGCLWGEEDIFNLDYYMLNLRNALSGYFPSNPGKTWFLTFCGPSQSYTDLASVFGTDYFTHDCFYGQGNMSRGQGSYENWSLANGENADSSSYDISAFQGSWSYIYDVPGSQRVFFGADIRGEYPYGKAANSRTLVINRLNGSYVSCSDLDWTPISNPSYTESQKIQWESTVDSGCGENLADFRLYSGAWYFDSTNANNYCRSVIDFYRQRFYRSTLDTPHFDKTYVAAYQANYQPLDYLVYQGIVEDVLHTDFMQPHTGFTDWPVIQHGLGMYSSCLMIKWNPYHDEYVGSRKLYMLLQQTDTDQDAISDMPFIDVTDQFLERFEEVHGQALNPLGLILMILYKPGSSTGSRVTSKGETDDLR